MRKLIYYMLLILTCYLPFYSLFGQDTIAIDMYDAVEMALNNKAFLFQPVIEQEYKQGYVLPPTEINYRVGQLYSPDIGWKVELSQDFGNLFCFKNHSELEQATKSYKANKVLHEMKKYEIEIKSVYMQWLYFYHVLDLVSTKREYAMKSVSVSNLKVDLGEHELIDDLFTEMQASQLETEYLEYQYNLEITENKLRMLLNTKNHIRPKRKVLEMYMVHKKDDTSAFNGNYANDIIMDRIHISEAIINLDKNKLFPQFQAGVFYQHVSSYNHLKGLQAAVKIPLWNNPAKEKIVQNKIYAEQLTKEYSFKKLQSELEIENLIMELDKIFIKIRHYQNHAIPAANLLLSSSAVKYQKEDIEFEAYYEKLNRALQIKQEYLDLIYMYNLTALKLEIYTK